MISRADFRNGMVILVDNEPYQITWFQNHKPGKGGAVMRVKLRHVKKGGTIDRTFKSGEKFEELSNPCFGPELKIDFDDITYYKKVGENTKSWDEVPKDVKATFDKLGIIEAEQKYLAGIGAQVESESIYHNMLKELTDKNIIFCSNIREVNLSC